MASVKIHQQQPHALSTNHTHNHRDINLILHSTPLPSSAPYFSLLSAAYHIFHLAEHSISSQFPIPRVTPPPTHTQILLLHPSAGAAPHQQHHKEQQAKVFEADMVSFVEA